MTPPTKSMSAPRLLKAEALLRPEFDGPHEMWDGVVMLRESCGFDSDSVAATVITLIGVHVDRFKLGRVSASSAGFVLARDPDRLLVPDAAFVSTERARRIVPGTFVEGPPDLAVEVRSPSDSWSAVMRKAGIWIAHGARVVWAIDPEQRVVVVSRGFDPPQTLTPADMLDGAPVLPRFRLKVARLFVGL